MSANAAREIYGVAVDETNGVDMAETLRLREATLRRGARRRKPAQTEST